MGSGAHLPVQGPRTLTLRQMNLWGAQLEALGNPCSCTDLGNRTPYLRLPTPVSLNLFVFVLGYCESQSSLCSPHEAAFPCGPQVGMGKGERSGGVGSSVQSS